MKTTSILHIVIIMCLLSITTHALQTPYIISATALSDSSVQLNIRNNDFSGKGFHLLRKTSSSAVFTLVKSTQDTNSVVIDNGLSPEISYSYSVLAFNDTEVSDTSNVVEVTTLSLVEIFKSPEIISLRWGFDTGTVRIQFYDSSNCEQGFHFYRSKNFGPYKVVGSIASSYPKGMGEVEWIDKNLEPNVWYEYIVATTKPNNGGGLTSMSDTVYTLHASSLLNSLKKITLTEKLSSFPIDFKGWVMHVGDTILLTENNAPDSCYSVLSIKDRKYPKFEGYEKTDLLEITNSNYIYSEEYAREYTYYVNNCFLWKTSGKILYKYSYENDEFILKDSLKLITGDFKYKGIVGPVNDNEIIFAAVEYISSTFYARFRQHDTGLTFLNDLQRVYYEGRSYYGRTLVNNTLFFNHDFGMDPRAVIMDYSFNNEYPITKVVYKYNYDEYIIDSTFEKEINTLASFSIKNDYVIESLSPDYRCLFVDTSKSQVIIAYQDSLVIYECLIDDSNPISFNKKSNKNFLNKISFSSICNSTIKINNLTNERINSIKIYNLAGRLIKNVPFNGERKKDIIIKINKNASSIYILQIHTNLGIIASKIQMMK